MSIFNLKAQINVMYIKWYNDLERFYSKYDIDTKKKKEFHDILISRVELAKLWKLFISSIINDKIAKLQDYNYIMKYEAKTIENIPDNYYKIAEDIIQNIEAIHDEFDKLNINYI